MAQYLSKYLFEKYEDEAIFASSKCVLPGITSMNPESVADVVDDANIMLTSLIIICNYIRDTFGKRAILPESAHNLGTGYIEAEYRTYEYKKEKGMEKEHINFWYIQDYSHLTSQKLPLTNDCSCHFWQHHPQWSLPLLAQFL